MKVNLFGRAIFLAMLAFLISTFVYFSFANIYSSKILNIAEFNDQFGSGIYQFRKLSGWLLLAFYEYIQTLHIDYQIFKFKFQHPKTDPALYLSFYGLNTFFLMLSAVIFTLIGESRLFKATEPEKILIGSLLIFVIALSQFVIVPYDVSSYFFLLLFFCFFLKFLNRQDSKNLTILILILAVSALNRESAALSVSLAATLLYLKNGFKKTTVTPVAILAAVFLSVYVVLRLFSQSFSTNDGNLLIENLTQPKNLLGLLFWAVFLVFSLILAKDALATRGILLFHLLSAPYILMCFYSGILYEVRLYVPLFISSVLLARVNLHKLLLEKTIFNSIP